MTNTLQPSLRKAAILIDTLDPRSADALLEQMGDEQAARVRSAVMQLGEIDTAERRQVVREFMGNDKAAAAVPDEQQPVDDSARTGPASASASTPASASTLISASTPASPSSEVDNTATERKDSTPPFAFLEGATAEQVSQQLRDEHPQTLALVTAHLPPKKAAEVLKQLSPELQSEVLRRIALLDEMDPHVVREVEQHLHVVFARYHLPQKPSGVGRGVLRAILNVVDERERDVMVQRLSQRDQSLATSVSPESRSSDEPNVDTTGPASLERRTAEGESSAMPQASAILSPKQAVTPRFESPINNERSKREPPTTSPPSPAETGGFNPVATVKGAEKALRQSSRPVPTRKLTFEDVSRLDTPSFVRVLRAAHPQVTLLALAGARRDLVARLLGELSRTEAKAFSRKMEQIGPTRLSDIEHAQNRLAEIAAELVKKGQITLPEPKRRFAAAA